VVKAAQKFYVSPAHGEDEIRRTIEIFSDALSAAAERRHPDRRTRA
jgi:hypothetical protein